jgi:hypothetical protein
MQQLAEQVRIEAGPDAQQAALAKTRSIAGSAAAPASMATCTKAGLAAAGTALADGAVSIRPRSRSTRRQA